jgi:hypothetical protein
VLDLHLWVRAELPVGRCLFALAGADLDQVCKRDGPDIPVKPGLALFFAIAVPEVGAVSKVRSISNGARSQGNEPKARLLGGAFRWMPTALPPRDGHPKTSAIREISSGVGLVVGAAWKGREGGQSYRHDADLSRISPVSARLLGTMQCPAVKTRYVLSFPMPEVPKISSEGQVTVPAAIRRALGAGAGSPIG